MNERGKSNWDHLPAVAVHNESQLASKPNLKMNLAAIKPTAYEDR